MKLIYNVLYTFFVLIEVLILAYVVSSFFSPSNKLRKGLSNIMEPILDPVRFLLKRSVFNTAVADLSPIISFVIVNFLQDFFLRLI